MFLNVYKAPHDPSSVQPLLNWTPILKTIAIGGFNSVYWAWQPGANKYYGQREEIQRWAEEHNLTCLIVGNPTHRAGNTLDLAFNNVSETMAWVGTDECMTSDHLPICGFVPIHKSSAACLPMHNGKLKVSKANIPQFTRVVSQCLPPSTTLNTVEETENYAQGKCWALESALKATGKRSIKENGRSASWWTPECKFAHLEYQEAVEELERTTKAKKFRAKIASAKREHWNRKVEDIRNANDTFRLMKWASPRQANITPALRYEGRFISDHAESAMTL